jgi:protein SCO1/2
MDVSEDKKPWYKSLFLWYFVIGVVTLTALRPFLRREPPPPPVLRQLPAFELVDQNHKTFSLSDLQDQVWVANFIFTRCGSICPILTHQMASLQERYETYGFDEIKLLSISVDPEYDTPDVLKEYAELNGADPERWTFLTGDLEAVRALVIEGFATAMSEQLENEAGMMDIAHTGKFVIVDRQGAIRGYYDSDQEGLDEVYHRSRHVLNESR